MGCPSFIDSASLNSPEIKGAATPRKTEILPLGHWFRTRGSFPGTDFCCLIYEAIRDLVFFAVEAFGGLGCACPSWEFGTLAVPSPILTGFFGGDIDGGAGGPRPRGVVGSDCCKIHRVSPQARDVFGCHVPTDSDLPSCAFLGIIYPIQNLKRENKEQAICCVPAIRGLAGKQTCWQGRFRGIQEFFFCTPI